MLEKKRKSFTIYAPSSQNPLTKRVVRPYPKKEDENTMINCVAPVGIIQGKVNQIKPPSCQVKHNVPALVFSFGGFTDNNFHKFSEVIIPLFITSRHFRSRVQFVVTDNMLGENWKFNKILKHLSPYDVIDANEEGDKRVHCFPAAVVGLRYCTLQTSNANFFCFVFGGFFDEGMIFKADYLNFVCYCFFHLKYIQQLGISMDWENLIS